MKGDNMNTITIFTRDGSWMARYGGPDAEAIKHLFDTDTLPTAFPADVGADFVVKTIRELNPGTEVTLA